MNQTPIKRYFAQGAAAPGASTPIIGTSVIPKFNGRWNITLALATGAVLRLYSGNTDLTLTKIHAVNSGATLTAGNLYAFSFQVAPGASYNLGLATDAALDLLQVDEVYLGAV